MEVLILKTKEILEKDWKRLDDIKYTDNGRHLGELKDTDSSEVLLFLNNPSIVDDKITWRDVIDTTSCPNDLYISAKFRVEEVGINRYVLKANGKNVIALDFSDDVLRQDIEGVLPSEYYTIGRMFFECIHWTRDFLEHEAKKCLSEVALNIENIKFLSGYYNYKKYQDSRHKYMKIINNLAKNPGEEVDWELKYLLSQVQYVMKRYDKREPWNYSDFEKWLGDKYYAKSIMEWGEMNKSIANVEFSNYNNFIEINKSYFGEINIYEELRKLKEQRNLVSHNIRNLVEQEEIEISKAIGNMREIAHKFKNKKLEDSLKKREDKIEGVFKKINTNK